MATESVIKPAPVEDRPNPVTTPHSHSGEESVQTVTPQADAPESYKSLQLLKEWPVVLYLLNKGQEAYNSVKHSNKVTETGLNISEKIVFTFTACSGSIIQKMRPVFKFVDYPASEGLERLQKYFPVVKESPEKVYDSVVERLVKFISPAVNTALSMTEVGRRQVKRTTKTVIKCSRKIITMVENGLERLEKSITGKKLQTGAEQSDQAETSQEPAAAASTWGGKVRSAARTAVGWAASGPFFLVGACCWLLERLPVVGRFLAEGPASREVSAASSYSSLSDEQAAGQGDTAPLPPQLSQATQ